jgi:hypothetical protein
MNAPAYKLAKVLSRKLGIYIPVSYIFNVKNSVHLINDLLEIPYDENLNFASFDVTNMYSNVPTIDLINTIELMCDHT